MTRSRLLFFALYHSFSLGLIACDSSDASKPTGACILRSPSEPDSEVWLLPSRSEAQKLDKAVRNRHQGTVNLLFAKYDSRTVPAGTPCQRLKSEDGFSQVRATGKDIEGWVPSNQSGLLE